MGNQINKPTDYFNTALWTATGAQSITGVGFQPDLVWVKPRSTAASHHIMDAVRGASKYIQSDTTDAEATAATFLTSFDSDGFSFGSGNWSDSRTVVGWNWLAGGTASSNTDGSETTSVSANTTSGFSIVSYTGTGTNDTFGHGLGVKPSMIITKSRDTAGLDWRTYHASLGATKYITLNLTTAETTESNFMNNTEPTSSVFTLGTGTTPNKLGDAYIAYCFAEKKGFSKFGSYVGNGNADGPFVYTGFKPAFVIVKSTGVQDWFIIDNKRNTFNVSNTALLPNASDADYTDTNIYGKDMLSNGFKVRGSASRQNGSGSTYIYMAFAENPLVGTNNIPATAR